MRKIILAVFHRSTFLPLLQKGVFILLTLLFPIQKIYAAPKADFTVSPLAGCSPLVVQFKDASTGSPTSYLWRFGNGNTSTSTNPGAIYYNPGSYDVTLIVKDGSGNTDSITKKGIITVYFPPVTNFSASPKRGCAPASIKFEDSCKNGSGVITSWLWDFGDGHVSTKQWPSNIYTTAGSYNVSLIAKDTNGCQATLTKKNFINITNHVNANFVASDSESCKSPFTTTFTPSVTGGTGGTYTHTWDFGDGNNSFKATTQNTYKTAGAFNVRLIAKDSLGCIDTFIRASYIKIGNATVDYTYSTSTGCNPTVVNFKSTSTGVTSVTTYKWDFGDGDTSNSTKQNPAHTYLKAGTFTVKLFVAVSTICKDSMVKSNIITIKQSPVADFSVSDSGFCKAPATVNFTDKSVSAVSYDWKFGDGGISTSASPSHTYKSGGSFSVTLTVTASNGCTNALSKKSSIKILPPAAYFVPTKFEGCAALTTQFLDSTSSVDSVTSYFWKFGDGDTSTLRNPTHTYTASGRYNASLKVTTKGGCTDTFNYYPIKVGAKPKSNFTATPTNKCAGDTTSVKFTNLTNSGSVKADSFYWQFGDGKFSIDSFPIYKYHSQPDSYDVTLVSYNNGCPDTLKIKKYINIKGPYAAASTINADCKSDTVTYINLSKEYTSFFWKFDDGSTSTDSVAKKKYAKMGTFHDTWLYTKNSITGCEDSIIVQVVVNAKFNLDFSTKDTFICAPYKVQFKDTCNFPVSLSWDFGYGKPSVQHNPSNVYDTAGFYTVSLTATTLTGCVSKLTKKNYITANRPKVKFYSDKTGGCAPIRIAFTDSSKSQTPIVKRVWKFGDGTTVTTTSDTVSHYYATFPHSQTSGYTVVLTVTDQKGCSDSNTKKVYPTYPKPDLVVNPMIGCAQLDFIFQPARVDTNGIGPFKCFWSFGDGTTSGNSQISKIYAKTGTYPVKLKVTDAYGCTDSVTRSVLIYKEHPKAKLTGNPTTANCPPLATSFRDTSSPSPFAPIAKWTWYFGDGSVSHLQHPSKVYTLAGQFDVTLVVEDTVGCADSVVYKDFIKIKGPVGSYTLDKRTGCQPVTVNYVATSKNAKTFTWDMGDGNILNGKTTTHTYNVDGVFKPSLILTDSTGCKVVLPPTDSITVKPGPNADFVFTGICSHAPTLFSDTSTSGNKTTIKNYLWDFGDGGFSTQKNPKNTYAFSGNYTVTHVVENTVGCADTVSKTIHIGGVNAAFEPRDTTGCKYSPIKFRDKSFGDTTIVNWLWSFDDGDSSTLKNPIHAYPNKGLYKVWLYVMDKRGCFDTITSTKTIIIGDSSAPRAPVIYTASVVDDKSVSVSFTPYYDIDFASYTVFRLEGTTYKVAGVITNINDTIFTDNNLDTRNNSYTYKVQTKTLCGKMSSLDSVRPHTTMNLITKPAINAINLSWNNYQGWDSVIRYEVYIVDKKDRTKRTLIATLPGGLNAFTDTSVKCFTTNNYLIIAIKNDMSSIVSLSDTAGGYPIHVPNPPKVEVLTATVTPEDKIKILWSVPVVRKFFVEKSEDGTTYLPLASLDSLQNTTQDDKVSPSERSYYYRLRVLDTCGDVSPYSNYGKTILLKVDSTTEGRPRLVWSPYEIWKEKVAYYDIELRQKDGSFIYIGSTPDGNTNEYIDNTTDLNSLPEYCYRVTAHRNDGIVVPNHMTSTSNVACTHINSTLFYPNVFTPNDDGKNDFFEIKGTYVKEYLLVVYNRWGEKVFTSDDIHKTWDGKFLGKPCQMDQYVYTVVAKGVSGSVYNHTGFVVLVK